MASVGKTTRRAVSWTLEVVGLAAALRVSIVAIAATPVLIVAGFPLPVGAWRWSAAVALVAPLAAKAISFDRPSSQLIAVRVLRWFGIGLRRRSRRSLIAWPMAAGLLVLPALRIHSIYHERQARALIAMGSNGLAAAHYLKASMVIGDGRGRVIERAALCFYRDGQFQSAIDLLEKRFEADNDLSRVGYRALWRSYRGSLQFEKALRVLHHAMENDVSMARESAGAIPVVERELADAKGGSAPARLRFVLRSSTPLASAPMLSGNWTSDGRPSEEAGWRPTPMTSKDEGRSWTAERLLHPSGDFPYVVLATPGDDPTTTAAVAMGRFRVNGAAQSTVNLSPIAPIEPIAPASERNGPADGRARVVVLWPDGFSWHLVNQYVRRGLMPNVARLLGNGARAEMITPRPAYTSVAYRRMVDLDAVSTAGEGPPLFHTLLVQLKGIPFLDGFIPRGLLRAVADDQTTIFHVLAQHGLRAANLVFNDAFVASPTDLTINGAASVQVGQEARLTKREKYRTVTEGYSARVARDILKLDILATRGRALTEFKAVPFMIGIQDTESKAVAGLRVWQEQDLDFLLLRFPSVDIISHGYWDTINEDPVHNLMLEAYRHVDAVVGRFNQQLDADDTLILASDHGEEDTLHHHPVALLIAAGPGLAPGDSLGTIPIDHFPIVVLSRFAITDGADRLTTDERARLFPSGVAR